MQELVDITITPKTIQHRNINKIIFEVNVRPVIQLVYNMKRQTKTTKRRQDEKACKPVDET